MGIGLEIIIQKPGIVFFVELIVLSILFLGSAMISASEVALFSLNPIDLQNLEASKSKNSKLILQLLKQPERLLANILIGNNFLNISIVLISTYITRSFIDFSQTPLLGFIIQVVVVTFVILLVCEIIPKVFAIDHKISVAHFMAGPILVMDKIFYPITLLLISSTSIVQKRLAGKSNNVSIDDLSNALDITSSSLKDEQKLLQGIVKFGNTDVNAIMQPRTDVIAADSTDDLKKVLSIIIENGYSRIPVYEETLDKIKGILFTKDLLPYIHENNTFNWQALIRPAYFVPETKKIDDLLADFQKTKNHIAIVVDEYGGTCGIVTMEDILEEIIGEISDESDVDEELLYKKFSHNCYLFEAKILLNDFYRITGIEDTIFNDIDGEFETLAGLILELKGEIPSKGDRLDFKNLTFVIESVDKRRIKQIKTIVNN